MTPDPETLLPPSPTAHDDFLPRVMDRIHHIRAQRRARKRLLRNSLLLLIASFAFWTSLRQSPKFSPSTFTTSPVDAAQAGVKWLSAHQSPNGAWNAQDGGGHPRFSPGVSALATLALLHAPHGAPDDTLANAIRYLESTLDPTPHAHPQGPDLYNHLLTLHALLEAHAREPRPHRADLLRNSLASLVQQQQPDGGWGYPGDDPIAYHAQHSIRSNAAVTWWVCELLHSARHLDVPGAPRARQHAREWLAACFPADSPPRYHPNSPPADQNSALYWMAMLWQGASPTNLPSPDRPDVYRDIFRHRSLSRAPADSPPHGQTPDGAWSRPRDRWWSAGGQIYTTAAAILATAPQS